MVVVFFFTLIFSLWIVAGSKEEIDTPDIMTDCVPKVAVLRRVGELTDSFCSELCRAVSLVCRSKAMAETQQLEQVWCVEWGHHRERQAGSDRVT